MDQLLPSLDPLLAPLSVVFRKEVFDLFRRMVAAWIVCLGRHTICRVWETTGQARLRNGSRPQGSVAGRGVGID